MSDDLKNILSSLNNEIEQEKLLEYLNKQLTEQDQHALESQMNDDAFMSDAMDGLQQLNNSHKVPSIVTELNSGLQKQLDKNKTRRKKRNAGPESSVYYSIIILLVLVVIAFVVIRMFVTN